MLGVINSFEDAERILEIGGSYIVCGTILGFGDARLALLVVQLLPPKESGSVFRFTNGYDRAWGSFATGAVVEKHDPSGMLGVLYEAYHRDPEQFFEYNNIQLQ